MTNRDGTKRGKKRLYLNFGFQLRDFQVGVGRVERHGVYPGRCADLEQPLLEVFLIGEHVFLRQLSALELPLQVLEGELGPLQALHVLHHPDELETRLLPLQVRVPDADYRPEQQRHQRYILP